jgi:uncharacterized protein YkwD
MRNPLSIAPAVLLAVCASLLITPLSAHAAGPRMDRLERGIVRHINHARARFGLHAMRRSAPLARAADVHSREMLAANYFSHSSPNGGYFATRIRRFVHSREVGETLAWTSRCGRHAAYQIVSMWMHSPPHRAILLSHGLHRVGIARRTGTLGSRHVCMVTGDFAR